MKLRNKKTGEVFEVESLGHAESLKEKNGYQVTLSWATEYENLSQCRTYDSLAELNAEWEDYKPASPLIKDEKNRKAIRAWTEAENCTSEMNLYYTLNRQEKYIIFHNPQTGSELQLCEFDYPDFKELCEYTIAELCGEEEK